MREKKLSRLCPVCRSTEGLVVHNQRFNLEKGNPLPDNYDVVCCSQCGFVFADVTCGQDLYDQYYKMFSKYEDENTGSGSGIKPFEMERLRQTCETLMCHAKDRDLMILDIGSAGGGLLKIMSDNGYNNLYALEPSEVCVKRINDLDGCKINAFNGSVFDDLLNVFNGQTFDLIVLSHVFEHVYDLQKAMKRIKSILNRNGLLYVEVPNLLGYRKFNKVPFYYFDCEHINHFDKNALRNLCGVFGFKDVVIGEKVIRVSEDDLYPAVYGLFEISFEPIDSVDEYVLLSGRCGVDGFLLDLIDQRVPVVVWGAGSYTKRLLATTKLLKCNLQFFVDSDSNKQGNELAGLLVLSPEVLRDFDGVIIISSALFSADIELEIKRMGLDNKVIAFNTLN